MRLFRRDREPTRTMARTHERWAQINMVLHEQGTMIGAAAAKMIHVATHPRGYCERPALLQTIELPEPLFQAAMEADPIAGERHEAALRRYADNEVAEGVDAWLREGAQPANGNIRASSSHRAPTLEDLLALSPGEFEDEVARLLERQGFQDVQRVGGAGDLGVDIVCRAEAGNLVAVQCKRYAPDNPIRSPAIQTFFGMVVRRRAHRGLYVTTSRFTDVAATLAAELDIEVVDGLELLRQLASAQPLRLRHEPASSTAPWNDQRKRGQGDAGGRMCPRCLVVIGPTEDRCPQCFRRW